MVQWFVKGGPVMYPLALCSVVALAAIIERLIFWMKERRARTPTLIHKLLHLTERGLFEDMVKVAVRYGIAPLRRAVTAFTARNRAAAPGLTRMLTNIEKAIHA